MKRSEKEAIIAEVAEKAARAVAMYFADFSKLTVAEETELRREFRKSSVEYNVVKNTLARKALEQLTGYDRVFDKLVGPTGIAYSYDDPSAPAKIIKKFSEKKNTSKNHHASSPNLSQNSTYHPKKKFTSARVVSLM